MTWKFNLWAFSSSAIVFSCGIWTFGVLAEPHFAFFVTTPRLDFWFNMHDKADTILGSCGRGNRMFDIIVWGNRTEEDE
jgi:hypothetical protein